MARNKQFTVDVLFNFQTENQGRFKTALKDVNREFDKQQKGFNGVNLDFLGLMFGGMALQRIFGGLFTSLKDGWKESTEETNSAVMALDKMAGAFDFLKFSFGQAFFESETVQKWIGSLTEKIINIAEWADDNPEIASTLTAIAGGLAAFGTIVFAAGTIKQWTNMGGTLDTFGKIFTDRYFDKLDTATTKLDKFKGVVGGLEGMAKDIAFVVSLKLAWDAIWDMDDILGDDETPVVERVKNILETTAAGAGIGWRLGGAKGAAIGATIGFSISAVVNAFDLLFNEGVIQGVFDWINEFFANLQEGFKNAFSALTFGDNEVEDKMVNPFEKVYDMLVDKFYDPTEEDSSALNELLKDPEGMNKLSSNINNILTPAFKKERAEINDTIDLYDKLNRVRSNAQKTLDLPDYVSSPTIFGLGTNTPKSG
ncbi:MAG: hypothetical protein EOL97_09600 [Spirochaetia bacterium]|nr:hypothetical protein [Spirochaetia bacterium]